MCRLEDNGDCFVQNKTENDVEQLGPGEESGFRGLGAFFNPCQEAGEHVVPIDILLLLLGW